MIKQIKKWFLNLQMKYQIMMIETVCLGVALIIITVTYSVQSTLYFQMVQQASEKIGMQQQGNAAIHQSFYSQMHIQKKNSKALYNLAALASFFSYSKQQFPKYEILTDTLNRACLFINQTKTNPVIFSLPIYCYQALNTSDYITLPNKSDELEYYYKTIQLLNQFTLLFDIAQGNSIALFDTPQNTLYYGYPQKFIFINFTVQTRPWYKHHFQQLSIYPNNQFFYSPTFESVTGGFYGGISFSILDQDKQLIGLLENVITLYDSTLIKVPFNFFLVDQSGQVMLSNIKSTAFVKYYVYNESITGFNITDWQAMYNHSYNLQVTNDLCNGYIEVLCFYNKLYQQLVFVDSSFVQGLNCTLIIYGNVTLQIELSNKFDSLLDQLSHSVVQNVYTQIFCCGILILFSGLMIHILFLPLFQLMKTIRQHALQMGNNIDKEFFKFLNYSKKPTNVFQQLGEGFLDLSDSINKRQNSKSLMCQIIEKLRYNLKDNTLDINFIKDQNIKLQNYNYSKLCFFTLNNLQKQFHPQNNNLYTIE